MRHKGPARESRAASRTEWVLARIDTPSLGWFLVAVAVLYALVGLLVYAPMLPGSVHSTVGVCPCGDVMQEIWFLKWTPWALVHGHNPLFSTMMDVPRGFNLLANTSMPALALLAAPVTLIWGPVASYNLLMWLAFPASGVAAAFVAERVTRSRIGAVVAGAVYAFSPFMTKQALGHLFLIFDPLPPLILYLVYRLLSVRDDRTRPRALWLGALVTVQFFVSAEVDALVCMTAVVGVVVFALGKVRRAQVRDVSRWLPQGRVAAGGAALAAVLLAYPVAYEFLGRQAIKGAAHFSPLSPFKLDVLAPLLPDRFEAVTFAPFLHTANLFTGGDLAENGGYLGVGLLVSLGLIVWRLRRDERVRVLAGTWVILEVLSLGRFLSVANHPLTWFVLPWRLVADLPLVKAILPVRLSVMTSLLAGLLVALGVGEWVTWLRRGPSPRHPERWRRANIGLVVLALVSAVLYAPHLPVETNPVPAVPAFFAGTAQDSIPTGSVVLTFPLANDPYSNPMYWQIVDDFRWRILGGEAIAPTTKGHPTGSPVGVRPVAAMQYLMGMTGASVTIPPVNAALEDRLRQLIRRNHVGTVVVVLATPHAAQVASVFTTLLGAPAVEGGADVWFHATGDLRRVASSS